jgi:hypothetical protein
MPNYTRRSSPQLATAQKRAAQKAEEVARVLRAFAASLNSLDALKLAVRGQLPTPRNWWRLQAGRFKKDPTFPDFVSQIQAARRREG